jgi:hypothetical protein
MTWSLAILDDGITDAAQTRFGKATAVEYDFYYQATDTDDGVPNTHADSVYLSALKTASAYDVIDYKVANAATGDYLSAPIEQALDQILAHPEVHVGAVNMSFGGPGYPYGFADEISQLADRGIPCVVAAGNGGTRAALEDPLYPAALPDVICVGSQDGAGHPSAFSQNGPAVDILADGENFPQSILAGTSFAAPQVAATVTQVEAIVSGLTGGPLGVAAVIDVLQEGGAGPRSRPDPADGATRYFLLDHQGSLDYAWAHYGGTPTRALEYIASYGDLIGALGANPNAGRLHFEHNGSVEERHISFDALDYIASYGDLVGAFGTDAYRGGAHYIATGVHEGRSVTFDGLEYVASYGDLIGAFGASERAGSSHFISNGFAEGRHTTFDGLEYIASYDDLIAAYGANRDAGATHFIKTGVHEGRFPDLFNAAQYLANYPDLQAAYGNDQDAATAHYITTGHLEGRTDDAPAHAAADFLF